MAAVQQRGDVFGDTDTIRRMVDNNQRIVPTLSNIDPFARKKGKKKVFIKNRAARIRAMKEKRLMEEQYEKNRKASEEVTNKNKIGDMELGLYVMNTGPVDNITNLSSFSGLASINIDDIKYTLVEISGSDSRLKKIYSYTLEYDLSFNRTKFNLPEVRHQSFKIKMTSKNGEEKYGLISFNFVTRKIIVRGGYFDCSSKTKFAGLSSQPANLLTALYKMKGKSQTMPSLKRANTIASYRTGNKFNYKKFINDKPTLGSNLALDIKNKGPTRVFMVMQDGSKISITNNGVIQVFFKGDLTKDKLEKTFTRIKKLRSDLKEYFGGASKVVEVKSKAAKRATLQPGPDVTRRGTACPKDRRPDPYSFGGKCPSGFHLRPNPQGQPCCYKNPKNTSQYRSKIQNIYRSAGVRMPNSVSNLFGLSKNSPTKRINVTNNTVRDPITMTRARVRQSNGTMKTINTIKIGSRQCVRYPKPKIIDVLTRIGYAAGGLEKKSKEELCALVAKVVKSNKDINMTNNKYVPKVGSVPLTVKGSGALVIGRRECLGYTKKEIEKFASKMGVPLGTREEMCGAMLTKYYDMVKKLRNKRNNNTERQKEAAKARANKTKNNFTKKRADTLYSIFLGKIQGFIKKYASENAEKTLPNQNSFMNHFATSVDMGLTRDVKDVSKRGWRKYFDTWADEYIRQYKGVYEPMFINSKAKKAAAAVEATRKRRENAAARKKKITFSVNNAKEDLKNSFVKLIDPKLRPAFNARINSFANKYSKFVETTNSGDLKSRKAAFYGYEKSMDNGPIRTYLRNVVSKLKPLKLKNNKIQRYQLSQNFKIVKGPVVEVL